MACGPDAAHESMLSGPETALLWINTLRFGEVRDERLTASSKPV